MEEKNELGDIILNKSPKEGANKKVILAAATLGVILIVVVLLMNTLNSENEENLPKAVLPPQPQQAALPSTQKEEVEEKPLFEDVEVIDESGNTEDEQLDAIAKKLKEESSVEATPKQPHIEEVKKTQVVHPLVQTVAKKTPHKELAPKKAQKTVAAPKGIHYIQVGSFSRYKPNKKFLSSIEKAGFNYRFYKTNVHGRTYTKVLVGPFRSEKEARKALRIVRKKIVKGAFLTKIKD